MPCARRRQHIQSVVESRPTATRMPATLMDLQPEPLFELGHDQLQQNLEVRTGAAGGLVGMMAGHLRPVLDSITDRVEVLAACVDLSRSRIPEAVRMSRRTSLQRPAGPRDRHRDIIQTEVGGKRCATSRQGRGTRHRTFQCASTRVVCFDSVSREATLRGLLPGERSGVGVVTCPSVFMGTLRNTCGRMIREGEGGDQRDAVVPALLTLGEHTAKPRRKSPAFLADIGAWSIADHTVSIFEQWRREM